MNRFNNDKDRTLQAKPPGVGVECRRECWQCRKHVGQAGGAIDKRTRMWVCAGCKRG